MSPVNLADLLDVLLLAGVMVALPGVFVIALARLLVHEITRAAAPGSGSVRCTPPITRGGSRLRWETFLFVAGVVGFLVSLGTASAPGLHALQVLTALMILVGAGAFIARG